MSDKIQANVEANANANALKEDSNSDLLKRLSNFLPKLANANQELQNKLDAVPKGTNPMQLDAFLRKDNDNESDDSSKCSDDEQASKVASSTGNATIEMTVALGNLESNPIALLDGEKEEGADESDENEAATIECNKNDDDIELLGKRKKSEGSKEEEEEDEEEDKPLFSVRSTRRKTSSLK